MKKTIIALTLAAFAFSASAGLKTTTLTGGTNNVAGSTTNSTPLTAIAVTGSDNLAMAAELKFTDATPGAGSFILTLDRSIDNSIWQTNFMSITCNTNGTTAAQTITNFSTGGVGYWRIGSQRNSTTNAVTNLNVKFYYKLGL